MTKTPKRRKLSIEILATVALCFGISLLLYLLISFLGRSIIDSYCFQHDIYLDEFELRRLDNTVYSIGFAVSALCFISTFLVLFGKKLAYIRQIIAGVHALQEGDLTHRVNLVGNNELTSLAQAVNYLSESEQEIKQKEQALAHEKEQLIRTLSHDIRTPLTSLMSYTELLAAKQSLDAAEQREYLALVGKKTAQIKQLTDILLDGGHRNPEYFEDARLLFEQLAGEFEEVLEQDFSLSVTLCLPSAFAGSFDISELRRIFDNLISNIQKYADPALPVILDVTKTDTGITISQRNAIRKTQTVTESHQMGLYSMRRIAQHYRGAAEASGIDGQFVLTVTLCEF